MSVCLSLHICVYMVKVVRSLSRRYSYVVQIKFRLAGRLVLVNSKGFRCGLIQMSTRGKFCDFCRSCCLQRSV